jgi:hypothetical protein
MFGTGERRKGVETKFRRKETVTEEMVPVGKNEMEGKRRRLQGTRQLKLPMQQVRNGEATAEAITNAEAEEVMEDNGDIGYAKSSGTTIGAMDINSLQRGLLGEDTGRSQPLDPYL